ncbi:MAG: hypothetical protein P1V81_11645 [Planctomycetota bacterium]|nr:hypothetical protein [Planctomycetota bacterium]
MPSQAPISRSGSRSGNAAFLLVIALLVVGGVVAWMLLSPTPSAPATPISTGPELSTPAPGHTSHTAPIAPAPERLTTGSPSRPNEDPRRFEGRGVVRGNVQTAVGISFPKVWTLVIEPSAALAGSGAPTERRVEFTAGEEDFTVEDLPLGGYAVRAEAEGLNGRAVHVLLERTSNAAYIMLQLTPSGFIEGQLVDAAEQPIEGLSVWLFPGAVGALGLTGASGREVDTNVDGMWRFDRVVDGPYTLLFGPPTAPLVDPVTITFQAPSLTWPSPELPPLTRLRLLVVDANEIPVQGARVRAGSPTPFDLETPATGELDVPNLRPGYIRVEVEHPLFGKGDLVRQLKGGDDGPHVITLVPGS